MKTTIQTRGLSVALTAFLAGSLCMAPSLRSQTLTGTFSDISESYNNNLEGGRTVPGITSFDSLLLMCAFEPAQSPQSQLGNGFSIPGTVVLELPWAASSVYGSTGYELLNPTSAFDQNLALSQMSWVVDHYWAAAAAETGTGTYVTRNALQIVLWELQRDGGEPSPSTSISLSSGDYTNTRNWPTTLGLANTMITALKNANVTSSYTLTNFTGSIYQLQNIPGVDGSFDYQAQQNFYAFAPVPEPSAALLGGLGALGILFRRRR